MLRSGSRRLVQRLAASQSSATSAAQTAVQDEWIGFTDAQPGRQSCELHTSLADAVWSLHRPQHRSFRLTVPAMKGLEVKVESMGESISEGTVAAVLKQPGDTVEEDEPILQIETDKVTIDVRSPEQGKVENILVKSEDTVTTGQLVATILPGEEGSSSQSQAKDGGDDSNEKSEGKGEQEKAQQAPKPEAHKDEAPSHTGRQPSISFPRRRLPDGTRISDLSEEEQAKQQQQQQQHAAPQQPQASQQTSSKPQDKQSPPNRKPAPWYVGKEQGTKLSQSRVLSEREMELVELGGA